MTATESIEMYIRKSLAWETEEFDMNSTQVNALLRVYREKITEFD